MDVNELPDDIDPAPADVRGEKRASFMGRVTLYDPMTGVPADEPTVIEAHRVITEAFAAAGYVATVDLTRTDNER